MSQIDKVAKHLNRHSKTGGISAKKLANLAHVPLQSVYKRIYDLRTLEGASIVSDYRTIKGRRKMFYRFAA